MRNFRPTERFCSEACQNERWSWVKGHRWWLRRRCLGRCAYRNCPKPKCSLRDHKFGVCTRCWSAVYCSDACRLDNWAHGGHEAECKAVSAEEAAAARAAFDADVASTAKYNRRLINLGHFFHLFSE